MSRPVTLTIILFLAFAEVAAACEPPVVASPAAVATPSPSAVWQVVRGDDYEGVIVPASDAPDLLWMVDGTLYEEYWTPTPADIEELEATIESAAARQLDAHQIPTDLSGYRRQYAGFVEEVRRLIRVSFFCDAYGQEWQSVPIFVLDGGACYFRITYDPVSGDFSDLSVNGEA